VSNHLISVKTETFSVILTGTSATEIVPANNQGQRVLSVRIVNVDGTSAADITLERYDGTTSYAIISTKSVAADSYLDSTFEFDLPRNWSLRATASAANDLVVHAQVEVFNRSRSVGQI